MLRWRLSTVRALGGGHDGNPRFCYFSYPTLRLSSSQFNCVDTDAGVPVANVAEEPDTSVVPLSSSESHLTGSQSVSSLSFGSSAGTLENCHPREAVRLRTGHSAIDTLRRFLALENVTSDGPLIFSPTTLRSLYYRAESRGQLGMLDFKMLTFLMALFGSLSIDAHVPVAYRVPLTSRLLGMSTRRTHWAFVLKVGKYKLESGMSLQDSDRFWLMCAELAAVRAKHLEPPSSDAYSAVLRARVHYHIIRRHSHHPGLHGYYLETLLAIRDPRLFDVAARDLAFLLRTHRVYRPWLRRLLHRLVVQHGGFLATQSQEAILTALWSRACRETPGTSGLILHNGLSDITLDDCALDTGAVARSLSATLFGLTGHLPCDKSRTRLGCLLSVFSPAHPLPLRWSSLILFSIFNTYEVSDFNGTRLTSNHTTPLVTLCWQVIFGLATVEKASQKLSSTLVTQCTRTRAVLQATRSLYHSWLTTMKSGLVSRDLACAIIASFLKMAGTLADANLFFDCRDLYRAESSLEGPRTLAQKFLAAQYIAAAVRVQGPLPDVVLTALEAFSLDSKLQRQVLVSAVKTLIPLDAALAYTLYNIAPKRKTGPDPGATHILAMSFAQYGTPHQATSLLTDGRFSLEERGFVISAIARNLRENPRIRHSQSAFVAIADELAALYHSHAPPEHFRGHLEQLFVVLAQHGRGNQLFPVVLSIFRRIPNYFRSRFLVRYCRMLLLHKQFATASKLLDAIDAVHPTIARSLSIVKDRIVIQTRAFRASKRTTPFRGPLSLRLSSRLRCSPCAGPLLEHSLQELLRSGRLLVAKQIFARAAATIPSTRCTALGNILLHGISCQPTPRNGRRVRKVLALLENLVKHHGFRPDRVTANILIKVMINWRSAFNSPRLRELFDQLVRGGYPAADYSSLHPPFGTQQTQPPDSSGFLKLSSFISFEKHSKPLFKMFIKAFYLCNDVEAARKVVGILKVEECRNTVAKKARQRARTRGRIKAAQRDMISLGTTAPPID